jgi:hypothetical protein
VSPISCKRESVSKGSSSEALHDIDILALWQVQEIGDTVPDFLISNELRFNKGFRGVTQAVIGWGMPEKTVRAAYG